MADNGASVVSRFEVECDEASSSGGSLDLGEEAGVEGIAWLMRLQDHFHQSAWLNPEPGRFWYGNTIEYVASVFDMYPLTLAGLGEAMGRLIKGRRV